MTPQDRAAIHRLAAAPSLYGEERKPAEQAYLNALRQGDEHDNPFMRFMYCVSEPVLDESHISYWRQRVREAIGAVV